LTKTVLQTLKSDAIQAYRKKEQNLLKQVCFSLSWNDSHDCKSKVFLNHVCKG